MFGKRLAQERQRLGWSQKQLAERMGVSRSAVAMLETDKSQLDVQRLVELGGDGFDVLYVLSGEPGKVAAARLLDWDLVFSILQGVQAWSTKRGISLPPHKESLVLKLLYQHLAEKGIVDQDAIEQAMQIAA